MATEKEDEDEIEIVEETEVEVEVDEDGEGEGKKPEKPAPKVEDARLRDDDDDDDEEDTTGREGETPEERAARRREERKRYKERKKQREAEREAELLRLRERDELNSRRIQQLEASFLKNEASAIDQRMFEAKRHYDVAEQMHAEAVAKGDGIMATRALQALDKAKAQLGQLKNAKDRISQLHQQQVRQPQRPQAPKADPIVAQKATAFVQKHNWVDPRTGGVDAKIANVIDEELTQSGFDPRTDDYWSELEKRLSERLPHRFPKKEAPGARKTPPVAGGLDRSSSGKTVFKLSKERKEAMMLSGDWDDPKRRNDMIREYMKYDKQNATR